MKVFKKLAALTLAVLMAVSVLPLGSAAKALEAYISAEEDTPRVVDDPAVQAVIDAIAALPAPADITLEHEELINGVQDMFAALTAEQQAQVSNHFILVTAFDVLAARHAEQTVSDYLDGLGNPIDIDATDAVNAAYNVYLALSERQKSFFNSELLEQLVSAKNQIDEGWAAIHNVESLIANLPNPPSPEDFDAITAARDAFENLTEVQRNEISPEALAYLVALEAMRDDIIAAQDVIDSIIELPYVIYPTDEPVIEAARAAYEALTDEQKALVTNYDYLVESEAVLEVVMGIDAVLAEYEPTIANLPYFYDALASYDALETYVNINGETKDVRGRVGNYQELRDVIDVIEEDEEEVDDLITEIEVIPYILLPEHQSLVEAARAAYDAMNAEQQALVSNYDYLVESEAVMEVVLLIDAVPKPIMPADEAAILAARAAYDELDAQVRVGNYEHLTLAEAALPVVLHIDALPAPSDILLENTDLINQVQAEYDALTAEEKEYVGNYSELQAAVERINELWQQVNDALALLEQVYDKRNDPLYPEDNDLITSARDAFNALNTDQQSYIAANFPHLLAELENAEEIMVAVLAVDSIPKPLMPEDEAALDAANAAYNALTPAQQQRVGNYENLEAANDAMVVVLMIAAIPNDPVMIAYTEQIEAAREAYDALSDLAKEYVGNYNDLVGAEGALDALWDAIQHVIDLIDAIPFPLYLHDAPAVVEARGAYDALTPEQQQYVYNYWKLVYAERDLATLYGQVAIVMTCITALPTPVTLDDYDTVAAIQRAYDALDSEQQAEITNYPKLQQAWAQLEALMEQIAAVEALIDAIPNPLTDENYDEFAAAVAAAREAYDAIANPADAAHVSNYDELLAAEAALYNEARLVEQMIDALPNPENITLGDADQISAAREAYDNLDERQQGHVGNYDDLVAAEQALAALLQQIIAVEELILDIPYQIHASDAAQIQLARSRYNALSAEQQARVSNYAELEIAEEILAVEMLIDAIGIDNNENLDLVEIEDRFNAALDAYNALDDEEKARAADGEWLEGLAVYYEQCNGWDDGVPFIDCIMNAFANPNNAEIVNAAYAALFSKGYLHFGELQDNQSAYIVYCVLAVYRYDTYYIDFLENEGDTGNDRMNVLMYISYLHANLPPAIPGDINGDGMITGADALLIMRIALGTEQAPANVNADCDGNGVVNIADSLLALRISMGIA